jgi:hypothetical protein
MVLRAVVDEAELLIFPSVLLPEQYQSTYPSLFLDTFLQQNIKLHLISTVISTQVYHF